MISDVGACLDAVDTLGLAPNLGTGAEGSAADIYRQETAARLLLSSEEAEALVQQAC